MSQDVHEDLTAYIDGELDEERAAAMARALEADPALRALEARLRRTIDAVAALPAPQPSAALRRAVLSEIDTPTWRERLARWLSPPRLVPVGLAVAAAVAAVVVWPRSPTQPALDEEALLVAQHLDVVEDLDVLGLESPEDLAVVAALGELEGTP